MEKEIIKEKNIIDGEIEKIRKIAKKYKYYLEIGAVCSYEEEIHYKDFIKAVEEESIGFDILLEEFIKKDYPYFFENNN